MYPAGLKSLEQRAGEGITPNDAIMDKTRYGAHETCKTLGLARTQERNANNQVGSDYSRGSRVYRPVLASLEARYGTLPNKAARNTMLE